VRDARCRVVGPPAAKDLVSFAARDYAVPACGFFQDYPSSKECTMHMALRTYEASQMGMRLARLAAIVSPTIHEGHQPGMGDEGWIESEMQTAMRRR
jgi:hypothetical protein